MSVLRFNPRTFARPLHPQLMLSSLFTAFPIVRFFGVSKQKAKILSLTALPE
jgi:hypothetical protein